MESSNKYLDFFRTILSDTSAICGKISHYFKSVLSYSSNHTQRFVAFLLFIQLLYLFFSAVFSLFLWTGLAPASLFALFISFGIGIVFLILFLFKGIEAKAASYFGCALVYFGLAAFLAYSLGYSITIPGLSLLGGWCFWNLVYSIIIMLIATFRIFFLGIVYDYKKRDLSDNPTTQDAKTTP